MKDVLVIDDDAAVAMALRRVLERAGHTVRTAGGSAEGLAELRSQGADVVVVDIIMPFVNGVDTIRTIAQEFPWVRIIAISGGGNIGQPEFKPQAITTTAYLAAAVAAGAHATLTKPFQTRELLLVLGTSALIIDDEPAIRQALARVLERAGYTVRTAANGVDGLNSARDHGADIVITDIVMPHLNGVETIRTLRREFPHTRVVAISGGGDSGAGAYKPNALSTTAYLAAAQAAGAYAILTKPFETRDVLRAIGHQVDPA